ncbi:Phage integrase family protein [Butyrivibrio sp. YAB3001]|nr:Phage integrase family protein [Butyrivibrio sp. YAB3001]
MTPDVEECFKRIINNRKPPKTEPMIDGRTGFLYFDKDGSVVYSLHWEHYFKHIIQKYNKTYIVRIPKITPHVCRHTYCSNMAKSGVRIMNNIIKTDETYNNWISSLKKRYRSSQIKAASAVNREMLIFYWELVRNL